MWVAKLQGQWNLKPCQLPHVKFRALFGEEQVLEPVNGNIWLNSDKTENLQIPSQSSSLSRRRSLLSHGRRIPSFTLNPMITSPERGVLLGMPIRSRCTQTTPLPQDPRVKYELTYSRGSDISMTKEKIVLHQNNCNILLVYIGEYWRIGLWTIFLVVIPRRKNYNARSG